MKRSEINAIIRNADAFMQQQQFYLPPFAHWTPDEWRTKDGSVSEIVERKLGWDVTDFAQGDFGRVGLALFSIRNGLHDANNPTQGKTYAEKVLIVEPDQVTPMHFHWHKMEDIINRGGGKLAIQLYNATPEYGLADTDVTVSMDGVRRTVKAGTTVVLEAGESITLEPYCYHQFWGVGSRVLVGEVSKVNDDDKDNYFHQPLGRFPSIEEDEAPLYLLVNDYSAYFNPAQ